VIRLTALAPSVTAPFDEPTLERLSRVLGSVSLDFEIGFFERARRREPDCEPVLEALGHAYTQHGRLEEGLEVDRRLAELRPEDPIVQYNLACSYALLGSKEDGLEALGRAIELGYDDLEHLESDRDLDGIRDDERFAELVKKIRQ
jgi:tetratricopeptide (TPR) repeat protein